MVHVLPQVLQGCIREVQEILDEKCMPQHIPKVKNEAKYTSFNFGVGLFVFFALGILFIKI